MKFDLHKTFPYPVLRPGSDDYEESEFQGDVDIVIRKTEEEGENVADFRFQCVTSSEDLSAFIKEGKAFYVAVVSCRSTYLRISEQSSNSDFALSIPATHIRDEVKIDFFIVAADDIEDFSPQDLNSEYEGQSFSLSPGNVLAQDEPRIFYFDRELIKPVSSVFDIVVNDELEDGIWHLDLNSDRVKIVVSRVTKESLDFARASKEHRATLINSIYFAAVLYCISSMQSYPDDYSSYRWSDIFRKQAFNQGLDIDNQESYRLAQALLKRPLQLLTTYVFVDG